MYKGKRRWLNKAIDRGAYLLWYVETEKNTKGVEAWCNAGFTIADCNRVISLDIDVGNNLKASIDKLQIIVDEAEACIAALKQVDAFLKKQENKAKETE